MSIHYSEKLNLVDYKMKRRKPVNRGAVNFPINDPKYKDTKEGGMFVRLVIEEYADNVENFMICCGGGNTIIHDEELVGVDVPVNKEGHKKNMQEIYEMVFPHIDEEKSVLNPLWKEDYIHCRYESISYLVIITLGSTGWSGVDKETGDCWFATYDDLTIEGKTLYNNLEEIYKGHLIQLQTWLDT